MVITSQSFTPFIPANDALESSPLQDKAIALSTASAKLAGMLPQETRRTISRHMAVINSYYSNLIEGNNTQPHEIRAAQQGMFLDDPAKRDLQLESIAHIKVQQWLETAEPTLDMLYAPDFIKAIHAEFYRHVPESLRLLKNEQGEVIDIVVPGAWRQRDVKIGLHIPPPAEDIDTLMQQFCEVYHPGDYRGDRKVIAIMCAHHRFAWLHPFADGNGRVMRLFTDAGLKAMGMESYGVWSLSRGLARASAAYKSKLARADLLRQGDLDGRGQLSQNGLLEFAEFMLDAALDQVKYISELLKLESMKHRIENYIRARIDGRVIGLGSIKEIAGLVLYNAFITGKLDRAHALELCAMPERSARRLLAQLKEEGLLGEESSRSALSWEIPEHAEPWYFPQLMPGM